MPIIIPSSFPLREYVNAGVSFLTADNARAQDIRPLRVLVVNRMSEVLETETQILRLLANTPLQVEVTLVRQVTTSDTPLLSHYRRVAEVADSAFDAVLTVGEQADADADAEELAAVLELSQRAGSSALFVGGIAATALTRLYRVVSEALPTTVAGVVLHRTLDDGDLLAADADAVITVPVARAYRFAAESLTNAGLNVLATAAASGPHLMHHRATRRVFVLDHLEHTVGSFNRVLRRARAAGAPTLPVEHGAWGPQPWRAPAHLLITNWLTWLVYQPLSLADNTLSAKR